MVRDASFPQRALPHLHAPQPQVMDIYRQHFPAPLSSRRWLFVLPDAFSLLDNLLGDDSSSFGVAVGNEPSFEPVRFNINYTFLAQLVLCVKVQRARCFEVGFRLPQDGFRLPQVRFRLPQESFPDPLVSVLPHLNPR